MEEQHPIPQQISAYQFRLVGDMTLKQFFQVAGGALVALVLYSSTFPSYVKWPLIIFSFLTGIALAFFPLEDRPLSKWIILFLKAIYSPTLYVWRQTPVKHSFYMPEPEGQRTPTETAPVLDRAVREAGSLNLEQKEQEFLNKVSQQLAAPPAFIPKSVSVPQGQPKQDSVIRPQTISSQVKTPQTNRVQIPTQQKSEMTTAQSPKQNVSDISTASGITPTAGKKLDAQTARFSPESAPPMPPTTPNIIVGQVLDSSGKIVDSAILEIRDSEGRPVRALKSNQLGHFMIVTPLANGKYEIITEKEGLVFEPISFEANGEIIPSIAIWAKHPQDTNVPLN